MTATGTGLNEDLANEVLRIKDNLVMYPDNRQKQSRQLTVRIGETPADKPGTVTEWLTQVIINREKHTPLRWITPVAKTEATIPAMEKLTTEQKALLKSMSYKPTSQHNMVSLAT